jgi:hypothetical protein
MPKFSNPHPGRPGRVKPPPGTALLISGAEVCPKFEQIETIRLGDEISEFGFF